MITVTEQPSRVNVDVPEVAAVSSEQLLGRVLDDETVAAPAEQARGQGVALLGEGGLLQRLTKRFLEAALDGEMDAHLGRGRYYIGEADRQ